MCLVFRTVKIVVVASVDISSFLYIFHDNANVHCLQHSQEAPSVSAFLVCPGAYGGSFAVFSDFHFLLCEWQRLSAVLSTAPIAVVCCVATTYFLYIGYKDVHCLQNSQEAPSVSDYLVCPEAWGG
jgi:hypothetical protein